MLNIDIAKKRKQMLAVRHAVIEWELFTICDLLFIFIISRTTVFQPLGKGHKRS